MLTLLDRTLGDRNRYSDNPILDELLLLLLVSSLLETVTALKCQIYVVPVVYVYVTRSSVDISNCDSNQ